MSVNGCYLLFVISDMTDSNNIMHRILLYMQYILHSNIYRSNLFICIWYTVFALLNKHTYLEPSSDLLLCICFLQLWVMSLLWLILSSLPSLSLSAPPALPVRKECAAQKGRFLAFFCQNIYTTFVSWMCERTTTTNCDERRGTRDERGRRREEGRRMTDIPVRHCAASLWGSSKWDHHQPLQQLPRPMAFPLLILLLLPFFFCGSLNYL